MVHVSLHGFFTQCYYATNVIIMVHVLYGAYTMLQRLLFLYLASC